jgi:hypothetical protein
VLCLCISALENSYAQKHTHSEEDNLAKGFISSLKSRNSSELQKFFPTVDVFRITAPDETKGKSDAEILEIAKPLSDGLDSAYYALLREADRLKIDLKKITFLRQKQSEIPMTNGGFYVQEIFFSYGKKKGSFTVGTAYIDKWYIYGIEKTEGVFTELK